MNYQPEVTGATDEAEEALIGAVLIQSSVDGGEAIRKVSAALEPFDFKGCRRDQKPWQWVRNARIYYAMTQCTLPPHQINVAHKMMELGILQEYDCSWLAHCVAATPCSLDYLDYAEVIKDYSLRRQVKGLAEKGDLSGIRKLTENTLIGKELKSSGIL